MTQHAAPAALRTTLPAKAEDAATHGYGSDSYPYTIIKRTPTTITLRSDDYVAKAGQGPRAYGDPVEYDYYSNPNGRLVVARKDKDGVYRVGGRKGPAVGLGYRLHRWDPSF